MFQLLDDLPADIQEAKKHLFLLWPERGIFGYDPETESRVRVSRGKTKYARDYLKCWVEAPNGDTLDGSAFDSGAAHCYSTVFQFKSDLFLDQERKTKWVAAIAKANELFPKKYPKFAKEREEYLRKKEAGEIKDETPLTMWTPAGYVLNGVPVRKIK